MAIKNKEYKKIVLEQLELIKEELQERFENVRETGLTKEVDEVMYKLNAIKTAILEIKNFS